MRRSSSKLDARHVPLRAGLRRPDRTGPREPASGLSPKVCSPPSRRREPPRSRLTKGSVASSARPVRREHRQTAPGRGRMGHGDRRWVGDGAPPRRGQVHPLPSKRGRERPAAGPHPRVRHLRRVPHAHGTPPCRPMGERRPRPAGLRAQRAPRPRPGHPRSGRAPCWRSSTRSTSTRQCWSGTRWAVRSVSRWRTRHPNGSTASCWSRLLEACRTSRCPARSASWRLDVAA